MLLPSLQEVITHKYPIKLAHKRTPRCDPTFPSQNQLRDNISLQSNVIVAYGNKMSIARAVSINCS